jgi:hypothetical protein
MKFKHILLVSGCIGDFIASESLIPEQMKDKIDYVYFFKPGLQTSAVTRKAVESVEYLCKICFPRMRKFEAMPSLWTLEGKKIKNDAVSLGCMDFTNDKFFFDKSNEPIVYHGSTFLKKTLSSIESPLPDKFASIHPRSKFRDFTKKEWEQCEMHLNKKKLQGVVLGTEDTFVPKSFLNLIHKTTLLEAIEILKKSSMHIGVDSSFSVLASKILNPKDVKIKVTNKPMIMGRAKYFFYSPNKEFPFLYYNKLDFSKSKKHQPHIHKIFL